MKKETSLTHEAQEDIHKAIDVMRHGGIILYPTDTIWGIGCDATNAEAVSKIYKIKQRADAKALITLVDSEAKIEAYVQDVPTMAWELIENSSKPLTIIYDHPRYLAPNLLAPDGSAAIRITKEAFSRQLCMQFKRPIVSTSANISGQPSPQTFSDITEEIRQSVDYICCSRQQEKEPSKPSSIIKLSDGNVIKIIRE